MTSGADTIVASATPPGTGGIGIVRISGDQTEEIARAMLGSLPEPRTATYRSFANGEGQKIDAGIALYFPAPASFTGESVLELHGHGGPIVVSLLVDAAIGLGARRAAPGEFSMRAFLNEKLDLVQAEAIADLVGSGTAQAARAALRSLSGAFSSAVEGLSAQLTGLRMHVEAAIDFPEEEIDFLSDDALLSRLRECAAAFDKLMDETRQGRVLRDGYQVVIVGKPNAGKSSLMNLLSGQDAAIVTEVAGTTRDILREQIDVDGLAVELVDTAGLRDDPDRVDGLIQWLFSHEPSVSLRGASVHLESVPGIPYHVYLIGAHARIAYVYMRPPAVPAEVDLGADGMRLRTAPLISGVAAPPGTVLFPGRLDLLSVTVLLGTPHEGRLWARVPDEGWEECALPLATTLTSWHPATGICYLRSDGNGVWEGRPESGLLRIVARRPELLPAKLVLVSALPGSGAMRRSGEFDGVVYKLTQQSTEIRGLPLGRYLVRIQFKQQGGSYSDEVVLAAASRTRVLEVGGP